MVTIGIQNLPEPLARAQAAYRDSTARLAAASRDRLACRVEHFASSVRFVLDEPNAARRLHDLTKDLRGVPRPSRLLPRVLEGAMALVGGDVGDIQIVDPATRSLRLVTQAGFGPEFSAALEFRGAQSTPLVDGASQLVGMAWTHFHRPHRPSECDLRMMELYADFAGEAVTRHLGLSSWHDQDGRAAISGLLDPARVREASVSVPFELCVMGRMTASFAGRAVGEQP